MVYPGPQALNIIQVIAKSTFPQISWQIWTCHPHTFFSSHAGCSRTLSFFWERVNAAGVSLWRSFRDLGPLQSHKAWGLRVVVCHPGGRHVQEALPWPVACPALTPGLPAGWWGNRHFHFPDHKLPWVACVYPDTTWLVPGGTAGPLSPSKRILLECPPAATLSLGREVGSHCFLLTAIHRAPLLPPPGPIILQHRGCVPQPVLGPSTVTCSTVSPSCGLVPRGTSQPGYPLVIPPISPSGPHCSG